MVEKNKSYVIDITGMTHEGQGVGRVEGFTVFVDGALEGEQVEVRVEKVNRNFSFGKLINILKPAVRRIEPFCEAFKRCGSCSLQHLDYQGQLDYKTKLVKDNLKRIGKLENVIVHDTIGMNEPLNYRNKAQFPVASGNGTVITGFYAKRTHEVIDSAECGIQDKSSDKIRRIIQGFIQEKNISVYDEKTGKGILRHIVTRVGFKTGEGMVVLVINGNVLPFQKEIVNRIIEGAPEVKSIFLNVNTGDTNVILGNKNVKIFGNDTIADYIGQYKFHISPLSFFQVNPVQTEVLYGKALEYAGLTGNETVFDIYCGIGTISLFLSQKAGKVYGVEVVEDAVRDARRNAEINGVENVEFVAGEAERVIPEMYAQGI
ncbi:MAG: 23S rRNA (uracil-5-)-methyltransferase RumA, partial [Clostridiales bacterium GWC2_40_7]